MFTRDRYENHRSFDLFSLPAIVVFYKALSSMRCSEAESAAETVLKCIYVSIDKFSDLKTLNISKETKIYRHSWKQHAKISITAKFEEEIL